MGEVIIQHSGPCVTTGNNVIASYNDPIEQLASAKLQKYR